MPLRLPADESVAVAELHVADRLSAAKPAGLVVETELAKEVWNVFVQKLIQALVESLHVLRIGLAVRQDRARLEHCILNDSLNGDDLLRVNGAGHESFRRLNSKHQNIRVVVAKEFLPEFFQALPHHLREIFSDELEVGLATICNRVAVHVDVDRPRLRAVPPRWTMIGFYPICSFDLVAVTVHDDAVIKLVETFLDDDRENSSVLVAIGKVVGIFFIISEHGWKRIVMIVART